MLFSDCKNNEVGEVEKMVEVVDRVKGLRGWRGWKGRIWWSEWRKFVMVKGVERVIGGVLREGCGRRKVN